jgi:hypothetical protein
LIFLKKSKRRRFSKKKSTGCNRIIPDFDFLYCFLNPARLQPQTGPGFKLWFFQFHFYLLLMILFFISLQNNYWFI